MSVLVRPALEGDRIAWDGFLAALPEGDVLQSWAWGETWQAAGEEPVRLVACDEAGAIRGVALTLVRPTVGGRTVAYVPHGPVWDRRAHDADAVADALVGEIARVGIAARAIVVKLDPRAGVTGSCADVERLASRHGLRRARHDLQATTTRIVALLDGGPALAATWDKDERNRVSRARREGVTTTIDRSADAASIDAFAALLEATAERDRFAARSPAFLARLAAAFAAGDGWLLTLAHLDGRPIAGVVTPRIGDRAFYLYGASLREEGLRHAFGSDAAMAAAMAAMAADGVAILDLWGVAEPDDPGADAAWIGFSRFKRRFGGAPLRHPGTWDLVLDRPGYLVRDLRERVRDIIAERRRK